MSDQWVTVEIDGLAKLNDDSLIAESSHLVDIHDVSGERRHRAPEKGHVIRDAVEIVSERSTPDHIRGETAADLIPILLDQCPQIANGD
jgi:hypothetical protein